MLMASSQNSQILKIDPRVTANASVMSRMLNSKELHIANSLRPYQTSKAKWNYLKRVYNQEHSAWLFWLKFKLGE